MYAYFDMPDPAFGIQLVYNRTDYPEVVTVVREGTVVREAEDRQFGVVNVQRGFDQVPSGLEAGSKK